MTKISLIITTYNRPLWLKKSIESAVNQTYKNLEIIVVDDGTTNADIAELVEKYGNIKYVYLNNSGPGVARNKGLEISSGEFIQFLDDDDWLEANSIEQKFNATQLLQEKSIVFSDLYLTDIWGNTTSRWFANYKRPLPSGNIFPSLIHANFLPIQSTLWEKRILQEINGFPHYSGHEDWAVYLAVAQKYSFYPIDIPLGYYRQHPTGLSKDFNEMMLGKISFQAEIVNSEGFKLLPITSQKSILVKYTLQQYAFGSKELSEDFLMKLYLISDTYDLRPRFISILHKMPRKLSQILVKANHFVHKTIL